jgi:twinkle protein
VTTLAHTPHGQSLSKEHSNLLAEKRGVSSDVAAKTGLVSRGNQLGFPYTDLEGQLRFMKWRAPNKRFFIEPPGVPLSLFNLSALQGIQSSHALVITEGEFDTLSCIEAGFPYSVSVPNGAPAVAGSGDVDPFTDKAFSYLWAGPDLIPELGITRRVILAVDADDPGRTLLGELALRLGPERCYGVRYPEGCKDANETVVKHGIKALWAALSNAFPLVSDELRPIDEIPIRLRTESYLPGWACLEKHLRVCPPELMVVTGVPSSGKSQWVTNLFLNISRQYGVNGALIQLEDDIERTRDDLTKYAESWFPDVDENGTFAKATAFLHDRIRVVAPSEDLNDKRDLKWLTKTIEIAAKRHDCKWVVIDPWNEVEHLFARGQNEAQYLNDAVRELKTRARRLGICLCIVCHPDKASGKIEGIDEMSLYSISGGAVWKNKADHGIVLGRKKDSYTTDVKIDKSKNWKLLGIPGQVELEFDQRTCSYIEAGKRGPRVVPVATEKNAQEQEAKATGTHNVPVIPAGRLNMKDEADDGSNPF